MSTEQNKEVARRYQDYRPEEIDDILTPDFVGHGRLPDGGDFSWTRDKHRQYWEARRGESPAPYRVFQQIAEGDLVATRMVSREGIELMSFKRFVGGRITELWEMYDTAQVKKSLEQKAKATKKQE